MEKWVTKTLVDYTMSTKFEDYPQAVIDQAKLFILDSIGCSLGGSRSAIGQTILPPFKSMGGNEEATIIGGGLKVPSIQAAFVNGTNANALDFDDTFLAIGHPGSSIIPAALAVGESRKTSGKDIINAILTAYDVGNRIGQAIQPSYERLQNVWGVGTWQTFSAVIAAAKTMQVNSDQMFNAFGVAGATAPVPNTQKWGWEASERPIHWVKEPTGWPCWTGTLAATLAENGFIGNRYILDGTNGFWIMAGSDQCDFKKMTEDLDNKDHILNKMSFKPYSSCRWQHPALDCIKMIIDDYQLLPTDVKEIVIDSFGWVKSQEVYEPVSIIDAQFCMPYTAAMVIMGKKPGPAWYTEENLKNEAIRKLARKVKVTVDPELDRRYFETDEISARVELTTQLDEKFVQFIDIPSGDPRNPITNEDIEDKFRTQASYVLNSERISQAVDMINEFDKLDHIADLMATVAG